jgi:rifampicin phosphotransferase
MSALLPTVPVSRSIPSPTLRERFGACLGWAAVLSFVLEGHAWAIPSPDVVVNLFASAAQVLGLLTVIFGKWFFSGSRRNVSGRPSAGYRIAFFVSAGLCALSIIGWGMFAARQKDLLNDRLQVNINRSSKEEGKAVGDVSLKELAFSDQQKRKDGVGTERIAEAVDHKEPLQMLDIRESEEVEMGIIPGVVGVRFPDLMKDPERYLDKSKVAYLFCANGNRSSELGSFLQEKGYECRFMIGGYEKWVAEDRLLETKDGSPRTELRAVPDFPNKDTLLDTPDVMALIESRKEVLFVDVRYPGDFETFGHLPGAVNIPIRKLSSPELDAALRALPKKPIVVPCYDRRSSFFGLIAGVRLSRLGYEFVGRYTVPEGFFVAGKDKAHVAAWKERHADQTLLSVVSAPLAGALNGIDARVGNLALSILMLVLLIRVVILPLTIRADRDRVVQARLEPRLKAIKSEFRDDPGAISRATTKLFRENGIRPFFGLLAAIAQLLLFTGFFSVVNEAVKESSRSFLWLPSIGAPDPTHVLPLAVSALLVLQLVITSKKRTLLRIALMAGAGAGLYFVTNELSSGANLYLVANVGLLVVQSAVSQSLLGGDRAARRARKASELEFQDVVPLRFADSITGCGGKATRLAALLEAGLPVPDGFVVRGRAIETWRKTGSWSPSGREHIFREHARLGSERVAVRSSGLNEDGSDKSYAGVFESLLDVRSDGLFAALEKVASSLASHRARAYSSAESETGSVVVQTMIPAEYAGVLFTEHPGISGSSAVELVAGLGDDLVSGRVDPMSFRFGRATGQRIGDRTPPIDLAPLLELGRRVEALFGRPQDIEWAYARGRFHLLQARDITRLCTQGDDAHAIRERERARLVELARGAREDEVVLSQNELTELLPEPTPFSLGWMEEMWGYGGTTELACRNLGIPYEALPDSPPLIVGAFGSLYINRLEEKRRLGKGPGSLAAFRLSRAAAELEREWREDYLPGLLNRMRLREAVDLSRFSFEEVVDLFDRTSREFLTIDYVRAETINVAADFYMKVAKRDLEKAGLDPVKHLSQLPPTVVNEAMNLLARIGRGEADLAAFMQLYGHRAPLDYEISQPRFHESPDVAMAMASRSTGAQDRPTSAPTQPEPIKKRVLRVSVERATRYQALKEEAKHHAMRQVAFLRAILLEIGRRKNVGDGIFQLLPSEIRELAKPGFDQSAAVRRILERQEAAEALREVKLPGDLIAGSLEAMDVERGSETIVPHVAATLRGTRVSGDGEVCGRVRVLRHAHEIDSFREGEILVARFTDPTWTPVFPLARGLVTEVGGWLSHAAIQAREYDITAIVGASGALDGLTTGQFVLLRANGTVERFDERRREIRTPASVPIQVARRSETVAAHLADLSPDGALIHLSGRSLTIGEEVNLQPPSPREPLGATVIRNGIPGIYGVRFQKSIDQAVAAEFGVLLSA